MPKQPKDTKIETRIRYILDVIGRHERVSVEEIIRKVAHSMDVDLPNKNFRRNIERDIKNLEDERDPRIGTVYLQPDGTEIPYEDRRQYKNIRKECFLTNSKGHVYGSGLLKDHLLLFYPQKGSVPKWFVSDFKKPIPNKRVLFIFNTFKSYIALHVSAEEMPFKLIVGRKIDQKLIPSILEEIRKTHPKASLLLLPDSAISRPIQGKRYGHVMFEFDSRPIQGHQLGSSVVELKWKRNQISIQDLGSTHGTYYQATELRKSEEKSLIDEFLDFDSENTSFLPRISFEDENMKPYVLPIGELEIMTNWVKVEFDIDKYSFQQDFNRREKLGLVNEFGHTLNDDGSERESNAPLDIPQVAMEDVNEVDLVDKVVDTLPISVRIGTTVFYILHLP